jgi:hypothetical protein
MLILENLKQFFFASVLFVTAVSVHWNFVGLNSNNTQRNAMASTNHSMQIEKKVEFKVSKEKVALASNSGNISL